MSVSISIALQKLLSEKHLYQSVDVGLEKFNELAKPIRDSFKSDRGEPRAIRDAELRLSLEEEQAKIGEWLPSDLDRGVVTGLGTRERILFDLPTVNTFCNVCHASWPFNPVSDGLSCADGQHQDETFYFGYECQQCKTNVVRFLVRRDKLKLQLAGRHPIEVLPTPKCLPKGPSKYYSNAMIAHHAGQTLAGLFLLRVFIEQFWRTIPDVQRVIQEKPKATGDEQGTAYQETLPADFKSRFPSLRDVYNKLSAALHSADENAALFDEARSKIDKHFDARKLFEL